MAPKELSKLEENAAFAEKREMEYMVELADCEGQEQEITAKLAKRLASGAPEAKISELAAERDRIQRRIVSLQQDLSAARDGARSARRAATEAAFAERTRELEAELQVAGERVVAAVRDAAAAWEEFDFVNRQCAPLKREIQAHARHYRLNGDAPKGPALPRADFPLPSRAFDLARQAPKAIEEFESARKAARQPPAAPPPLPARPYIVGGDSKRSRADRERIQQPESSKRLQRALTGQ